MNIEEKIENKIKELTDEMLEDKNMLRKDIIQRDYIPKSKIKEKIEEIKEYVEAAEICIEEKIIVADSDSLNYGRKEAHNKDIQILQELLEE